MVKDNYIAGLKWLAVYEVIGGLLGLGLLLPSLDGILQADYLYMLLVFAGVLLQCFSIYAGVVLFRSMRYSIEISIVCQCLQIVNVYTPVLVFRYVAGLAFGIGLSFIDGLQIVFTGSLSNLLLAFYHEYANSQIYVNLVALGLWFILNHERKAIAQDKKTDLIRSIAN